MGIFSDRFRIPGVRFRTRPPVEPVEIGIEGFPDTSAALLETLQAEGERRLIEQFGRATKRKPRVN